MTGFPGALTEQSGWGLQILRLISTGMTMELPTTKTTALTSIILARAHVRKTEQTVAVAEAEAVAGGGGTDPTNDLGHDDDEDGISSNGDGSDTAGDNPCGPGQSENCDDNCPDGYNPDQTDTNGNGDYCDDFGEDNCYNSISGFPELAGWSVHTTSVGHIPFDDPNHDRVQVIQDTDCYYEINLEDAGDFDYDTRLILNRLGNGDISLVYKFNPGDGTVFFHTLHGTLADGTPFEEYAGNGGTHSFMIPGGLDAAYCECAGAGGTGGEEDENCTLWPYNLGGEEYVGSGTLAVSPSRMDSQPAPSVGALSRKRVPLRELPTTHSTNKCNSRSL